MIYKWCKTDKKKRKKREAMKEVMEKEEVVNMVKKAAIKIRKKVGGKREVCVIILEY